MDKLSYYMNLETGTDLRSDPNCNSVECFTGHSFPYDEDKKPVEYKDTTGAEHLDEDIKDTHAHLGMTEQKLGKWTWNDKRDDGLLNWMPAPNAEAEEKPKKNTTEKAAPAKKETTKVETKAADSAPKAETAALQMEVEGPKKGKKVKAQKASKPSPKKAIKKISKSSKPVKAAKKSSGKRHNSETRETDNKNWPKHRFHFKNNYKGFPQKRKSRNSARNTMMSNWNTNTYAQKDE